MPLILGTNSIKDTGYDVDNSLRFNDGSTDYLSISGSTPDNRKKFTYSFWFKRSHLGTDQALLSYESDSNNRGQIQINTSNQLRYFERSGGSTTTDLVTNRLFRDVSSWYSIIISVDTSQGTDTNRVKIYVNGVQETSFATSTYPSQNYDTNANGTFTKNIGRRNVNGDYKLDGYLTEVVFVDGTQQANTDLGEFDSDSNIWKPKNVSGLTFGTNGFYLDFENSGSLGADVSGNGNNFTVNNLTSVDQSASTCTNNEATLNSLYKQASSYTIADGNLTANNSSNTWRGLAGTIGVSSGKWYWEAKAISGVGSSYLSFGIGDAEQIPNGDAEPTASSRIYSYKHNGDKANNNTQTSYGATWTNGDIISILYDADNGSLTFYKNGVSQGVAFSGLDTSKTWLPITENYGTAVMSMNFGSPPYSISSGNTDGNGYGNFEYAVPSGYFCLNTKNLAEYG